MAIETASQAAQPNRPGFGFHPVKVPLKVFSTSFKIHSACCAWDSKDPVSMNSIVQYNHSVESLTIDESRVHIIINQICHAIHISSVPFLEVTWQCEVLIFHLKVLIKNHFQLAFYIAWQHFERMQENLRSQIFRNGFKDLFGIPYSI